MRAVDSLFQLEYSAKLAHWAFPFESRFESRPAKESRLVAETRPVFRLAVATESVFQKVAATASRFPLLMHLLRVWVFRLDSARMSRWRRGSVLAQASAPEFQTARPTVSVRELPMRFPQVSAKE